MERTGLKITENTSIPLGEIEIRAVRSQGAGGQNVNKVSTAVHLRFDIGGSSLPVGLMQRLLKLARFEVALFVPLSHMEVGLAGPGEGFLDRA